MECKATNQDKSPPKKKKPPSKLSTLQSTDLFEASTAGMCTVQLSRLCKALSLTVRSEGETGYMSQI